jgi:hypothetical protein
MFNALGALVIAVNLAGIAHRTRTQTTMDFEFRSFYTLMDTVMEALAIEMYRSLKHD